MDNGHYGSIYYIIMNTQDNPINNKKNIIGLILLIPMLLCAEDFTSLLFHGNCTTCHFINKSVSAPSIIEVKKRYISAFTKKDDFVKYMKSFVLKPTVEKSIMNDAIEKYELMPEITFDEETVESIAQYIYKKDFK